MIRVAESAGFCFGVDRAVRLVETLLDEGQKVATLGPIIHNPNMVRDLQKKGCRIIETPAQAKEGEVVVIRSHGVGGEVYAQLAALSLPYRDATCPYVSKIQKIAAQESKNGKTVIIAGDRNHPEVQGIQGHCVKESYVIMEPEELEVLKDFLPENDQKNIVLVAQTTYNIKKWEKSSEIAKKLYTNVKIFDTICSATTKRQTEAIALAKRSDFMVVLGGLDSSNTKKLWQICSSFCETKLVQTIGELDLSELDGHLEIGVTAGASTPAYIIKEALHTMDENVNTNMEEIEDFAQLLEQSQETEKLYTGKRVRGIVTTIAANEIHVDINAKQAGIVSADELSDDPTLSISDIVKKGDEIELMVLKVNDQEGIVNLSKKRCDAQAGFDVIKQAKDDNAILDGVVTNVVKGGVLVLTNHIKVFVHKSQVSLSRLEEPKDLEPFLRQPVKIRIREVDEKRARASASIKDVLLDSKREKQDQFWEEAEIGKHYKGEVKSLTDYGAFVDLGGVDGMIHHTELSWTRIKHPKDVLSIGDVVEVYIKDLDKEKKRISLGYKKSEDDPWEIFKTNYQIGDEVPVTIVSFTAYGAFARIIPGIDGLIHISQIANQRVEKIADFLKVGQEVNAKIIDVNFDAKRVSLSMRALLTEEEQKHDEEEEAAAAEQEEAAPAEAE